MNPRVLIGAVIIKHILNLDDPETVAQISENMYLQYFLATAPIGEVIYDATVCPQDIAYPTDHGLPKKSREITEEVIDVHRRNSLREKSREPTGKPPGKPI